LVVAAADAQLARVVAEVVGTSTWRGRSTCLWVRCGQLVAS
jgi:hypothetical protein